MNWSVARKRLEEDFICEKLKGRIQYFYTHYHSAPDHYGRFAVRVDDVEVLKANPYNEVYYSKYAQEIKDFANIPEREWTKRGFTHEAVNQAAEDAGRQKAVVEGHIDSYDFPPAIETYMNQAAEKSLWSKEPLVRLFAILDRRIGRRSLMKVRDSYFEQPSWLRYFYKLRFDVEGISVPNTMHLLLSADGEIGLYAAQVDIVENLDQYLEDFYSSLWTNEFNESDFVDFLRKTNGFKAVTFIKTVGVYPKLPQEYKKIRWYNF